MPLTDTERRVITAALDREHPHHVCPTPGLWAASQMAVLRSLERKGLIAGAETVPTLTAAGIAAAKVSRALDPIRPGGESKLRPCPACGRPYDPARIPPPRVPLDISCACCCPEAECPPRGLPTVDMREADTDRLPRDPLSGGIACAWLDRQYEAYRRR